MKTRVNSVTEQVWSNIGAMGDNPAALVKYEGPTEYQIAPVAMVRPPVVVNTRPETVAISWRDYGHMVAEAVLFLRERGIKPGDRVALLGIDTLQWMVLNRAIQSLGAIVVPIYDVSDDKGVAHILNDSTPVLLLVENAALRDEKVAHELVADKALPVVLFADALAHLPNYTGKGATPGAWRNALAFRPEATAEYERLIATFAQGASPLPYSADDISTLIYTSGSTSLPKGAMLTHKNIVSSCVMLKALGFDFTTDDILLHYLPFAHVYGKANGLEIAEFFGVVSCFAPATQMKDALPLYRPTILLGVPKVWNRVRSELEKKAQSGAFDGKLLRFAFSHKTGIGGWIASHIFQKVRRKMGTDRVRLLLSGSAAIPMETVALFNQMGMNLREGYGLSETCGGFMANTLTDYAYGSLGKLGPGARIKLVKREGIDTEENTGILWVKGDFVFKGYWNKPDKNAELFDADGYFCTGDIVHIDESGRGWFRGRASRQKKLDIGKFYSEETIQTEMEKNLLIMACVPTGEGRSFVGALVFLDPEQAKRLAGPVAAGTDAMTFYAQNAAVRAAVAEQVKVANTALQPWEVIRQWEIVPVEPTVANGLLTTTLKIKTEEALKRFASTVEELYARKRA